MKTQLKQIRDAIDQFGGIADNIIFEKPATEFQLFEVENELRYSLPRSFRTILTTVSSHVKLSWFFDFKLHSPSAFNKIYSGEVHWDLDTIISINQEKDELVNDFFIDTSVSANKVWNQKFVFQEVGNGDYLSIDLNPETYGEVVYLSLDCGKGHGYVMASSFDDLLDRWSSLGFVGPESWQWLPFVKSATSGLIPSCENAMIWREMIGVKSYSMQ